MKVTKSYLKNIIKEELSHLEEASFADEISTRGFTGGEPDYPAQISVMVGSIIAAKNNLESALRTSDPKSAKREITFALEKLQQIIQTMSRQG